MINKIIICLIIPALIFVSSCSKKERQIHGEVTFTTGTFKINGIDGNVGSKISKDDVLITGSKSEAVVQISETAVITIRQNTVIKFLDLISSRNGTHIISTELDKGDTFHNIMKKGTNYTVKAPTAVASVRGTSFDISADSLKTRIKVKTGTVYVRKNSGSAGESEEIILTAGQSLEVKAHKDKRLWNKKFKQIAASDTEPFQPQDRLFLYSGEVITGTILERTEDYIILTDKGKIKVSRKNIQSQEIIR